MEPEWFYKPIEGYNRRYIRVGEFRQIQWCEEHGASGREDSPLCWAYDLWTELGSSKGDCVIVDKWLEV